MCGVTSAPRSHILRLLADLMVQEPAQGACTLVCKHQGAQYTSSRPCVYTHCLQTPGLRPTREKPRRGAAPKPLLTGSISRVRFVASETSDGPHIRPRSELGSPSNLFESKCARTLVCEKVVAPGPPKSGFESSVLILARVAAETLDPVLHTAFP